MLDVSRDATELFLKPLKQNAKKVAAQSLIKLGLDDFITSPQMR